MTDREPWFRKYRKPGRNGHRAEMTTVAGIKAEDWPRMLAAEAQGDLYERDIEERQ